VAACRGGRERDGKGRVISFFFEKCGVDIEAEALWSPVIDM
jgi:hypothetical protein